MIELKDIANAGKTALDKTPVKTVGKAIGQKATGAGPGPFRAGAAATVVGFATATLTYRALRDGFGGGGDDNEEGEE